MSCSRHRPVSSEKSGGVGSVCCSSDRRHNWYYLFDPGSQSGSTHSSPDLLEQHRRRTHPDQRTHRRDPLEDPPPTSWSPPRRRHHHLDKPSRAAIPHGLSPHEYAPARTTPGDLSKRCQTTYQALRTRGPQHRPRRPGTHRGRTDRRLLDLEPSVSVRQAGTLPVRSPCARPGSRRCPASWSRG